MTTNHPGGRSQQEKNVIASNASGGRVSTQAQRRFEHQANMDAYKRNGSVKPRTVHRKNVG